MNFIARLYSIDLFTVFGNFLGYFSCEIKSYFPWNEVAYVLKFGKCGKRQLSIKFEFTHFFMKKSCYEVELEKW